MPFLNELKQLNSDNLNQIRVLFNEIDGELQMKKGKEVVVDFLPRHCTPRPAQEKITPAYSDYEGGEIKKRLNALNYLKDLNVVLGHNVDSVHHRIDGNTNWHIEIKLNIENFRHFKIALKKATGKIVPKAAPRHILNYIIEAITIAREADPENPFITLDLNKQPNLSGINIDDIKSVLEILQNKEQILTIESENYPDVKTRSFYDYVMQYTAIFELQLSDNFDNWYTAYLLKKNQKTEALDPVYIKALYRLTIDIFTKFHLVPSTNIEITFLWTPTIYNYKDAVKYLLEKGILLQVNYKAIKDRGEFANIKLDVENFLSFKNEITHLYNKAFPSEITKKPGIQIPPNTKWEDIKIKFLNGHDVKIEVNGNKFDSDFKQMGFEDKKSRRPNKQWELLHQLLQKEGAISWQDAPEGKNTKSKGIEQAFGFEQEEDNEEQENRGFSYGRSADSVKKTKQLLSATLKAFFQIKDDPFFPYHKEKAYKIKIHLIS